MASYFFEGFLERLLDVTDSASMKLLEDATIYCVPTPGNVYVIQSIKICPWFGVYL